MSIGFCNYFDIFQNNFETLVTHKTDIKIHVIEVYPIETPRENKERAGLLPLQESITVP